MCSCIQHILVLCAQIYMYMHMQSRPQTAANVHVSAVYNGALRLQECFAADGGMYMYTYADAHKVDCSE